MQSLVIAVITSHSGKDCTLVEKLKFSMQSKITSLLKPKEKLQGSWALGKQCGKNGKGGMGIADRVEAVQLDKDIKGQTLRKRCLMVKDEEVEQSLAGFLCKFKGKVFQ